MSDGKQPVWLLSKSRSGNGWKVNMNDRLAIVTGGAGFIGSHLVRGLLKRGYAVQVIDNLATGRLENLEGLAEGFGDAFRFAEADIRDLAAMKRLFKNAEAVFHEAAIPSVQRSVDNPLDSNSANVDGFLNVLVAAKEWRIPKVVYASSSSVYGDSEILPKIESMTADPLSPYAVSKYAGELYGKVFSDIYGISNIGLRYFNVFGPRQDPTSDYAAVIPRFIVRMLTGNPPIIYGDGEQSRDFTFVENVVEANLVAAASEATGVAVNIGCGERFTLNQLVAMLNELLGTGFEPEYQEPRPGDVRHSLAGIEKARDEIGYRAGVGFKRGLQQTVEWFREKGLSS